MDEATAAAEAGARRGDLDRYVERRAACRFILGGAGGILVVGGLSESSFSDSPPVWRAAFIILAIFSGLLTGLAYILYDHKIDLINHPPQGVDTSDESYVKKCTERNAAKALFAGGVALLFGAGVVIVIAAILSATGASDEECTLVLKGGVEPIVCVSKP